MLLIYQYLRSLHSRTNLLLNRCHSCNQIPNPPKCKYIHKWTGISSIATECHNNNLVIILWLHQTYMHLKTCPLKWVSMDRKFPTFIINSSCHHTLVCHQTLVCHHTLVCHQTLVCHHNLVCRHTLVCHQTLVCHLNITTCYHNSYYSHHSNYSRHNQWTNSFTKDLIQKIERSQTHLWI